MPSLFPLSFKKTKNPYSNPHHPSHAPLPPPKQPTTQHSSSSASPNTNLATTLRPTTPPSPQNMLAEARQIAGRHPTTGKPLPRPIMPTQTASETNLASNARLNRALNAVERLGPSVERSAYLNRASQTRAVGGTRYDLLSAEGKRRREEERRMGGLVGGGEFYAPERRVSEFYGGVEDD